MIRINYDTLVEVSKSLDVKVKEPGADVSSILAQILASRMSENPEFLKNIILACGTVDSQAGKWMATGFVLCYEAFRLQMEKDFGVEEEEVINPDLCRSCGSPLILDKGEIICSNCKLVV